MAAEGRAARTLAEAERVSALLGARGLPCAVIGAAALAVHGYPRATADFDLATCTPVLAELYALRGELQQLGYQAEFHPPDADDPLGGVLLVRGEGFLPIEVVNLRNPLAGRPAALAEEALGSARAGAIEQSPLRVVALPYLIALKLAAGGARDRSDVLALLERQRTLELAALRQLCARHGLAERLARVLAELGPRP
ncbi:MAG: hypothetical protein KatS3mg102_0290 [Planctomycetota bacterium]|nr:MAG: hypothetical protein KatS3mg102_0290 [Planctomycetota bacterium]